MAAQLALNLHYAEDYGPEQFVVSDVNQEAFAWVNRWPHWPHKFLSIYGTAGAGKTHLAHVWTAQPLWLSNSHYNLSPDTVLQMSSCFIMDQPYCADTWLLHFYNLCLENQRSVLMTSLTPPSQWPVALADLKSRLATIPAIEIREPDDQLLLKIIHKLFRDRGVIISDLQAQYLMNRVERSVSHLKHLVQEIDAVALASKKPITNRLIKDYLTNDAFKA